MRSAVRSAFALLTVSAVLFQFSGCSDDEDEPNPGPSGTPSAEFVIQPGASNAGNMAFSPVRDTVQVGQIVRMRNGDSVTHNIVTQTAGGPSWGALSGGSAINRTANQAGTFTFVCTISGHTMSGVLVVLP